VIPAGTSFAPTAAAGYGLADATWDLGLGPLLPAVPVS
jgi:hypothetical protein